MASEVAWSNCFDILSHRISLPCVDSACNDLLVYCFRLIGCNREASGLAVHTLKHNRFSVDGLESIAKPEAVAECAPQCVALPSIFAEIQTST